MFDLKDEVGGIREYQMKSNGLRILIMEDHSAPVAATMVSYAIGSYDEAKGHTGAAHMLEHMMFKGTKRYHKKKNTQIASLLERVGAVMNANTGHDATHYFEVLPSDRWKLALDIEADRMRHSLLEESEFISEKSVIQNELERYFDYPTVLLSTAVWQEAFKTNGYHHPIIGWRQEVQDMPVSELKRLYDAYYQPSNAILTIVGDIDTKEVLKEVELRFSKIYDEGLPKRNEMVEPLQKERRFTQVEKPSGAELVKLAFKMPETLSRDAIALDLLGMILSHGKMSRLYQGLVEKGLVVSVNSGGAGTKRAGLFSIIATLAQDATHEKIEELILSELENIKKVGITQAELDRALSQIESEMSYSRDGLYSLISELSHAIAYGDWKMFLNYFDQATKICKEDIQEVAKRYLIPEKMTAGYLRVQGKKVSTDAVTSTEEAFHQPQQIEMEVSMAEVEDEIKKLLYEKTSKKILSTSYEKSAEVKVQNDLEMYAIKTSTKNVINLSGSIANAGTAYHQNIMVPAITAAMLDKGSKSKTKMEIAETLENLGAHIEFHADAEHLSFHLKLIEKDLPIILPLLAEQLKHPNFDPAEFEQYKKRQVVGLKRAMASTSSVGFNRLFESLYGEGHLNRTMSFKDQLAELENMSIQQINDFHQWHYGKQNFKAVFAGDINHDVFAMMDECFESWKAKNIETKLSKTIYEKAPHARENIAVSGVVNNDVFMGQPVPLLKHEADYIPLYMANYVLGGDFTSRLSNIVRDQHGYTYGVRSGLTGFSHQSTGLWIVHLIVNPVNLEASIDKTKEVIAEFCEKGITAEELAFRKETIKGKFKVNLSTTGGLVDQVLNACENGLGLGYVDAFPNLIEDLTLDQVNDAIRRYFSVGKLHTVCAGQFS